MKAVITIYPPSAHSINAEVVSGGLSDLDIYKSLNVLLTVYADRIVKDAERMVGSDPGALEQYLSKLLDFSSSDHVRRIVQDN